MFKVYKDKADHHPKDLRNKSEGQSHKFIKYRHYNATSKSYEIDLFSDMFLAPF